MKEFEDEEEEVFYEDVEELSEEEEEISGGAGTLDLGSYAKMTSSSTLTISVKDKLRSISSVVVSSGSGVVKKVWRSGTNVFVSRKKLGGVKIQVKGKMAGGTSAKVTYAIIFR